LGMGCVGWLCAARGRKILKLVQHDINWGVDGVSPFDRLRMTLVVIGGCEFTAVKGGSIPGGRCHSP